VRLEGLGQLKNPMTVYMGEIRNTYNIFVRKYTTQTTLQANVSWDVTMEIEEIY
jgi:hypothetical protein